MNNVRKLSFAFVTLCGVVTILGSATNTPKTLVASGGSRADGTVELFYEYSSMENPVINWESARNEAINKCRVWGYSSAEPFGAKKTRCIQGNQYGCGHFEVTVPYQCTGQKNLPGN